jgi:citrate synthase
MDRTRARNETGRAFQAMSSPYVPGLEGIVAAQTRISMVDGANGRLVYQGYVIADLAEQMSFEEVAYLLWNGRLPSHAELDALSLELAGSRSLTQAATITLDALPKDTDPMDVLRSVVSVQGVEHKLEKPSIPLAIHATASFPTILALFRRRQLGLEPIKPRADLGHAANYLYMLNGKESSPELVHALNTYLVLLADHGMNASTFTARVIASTESDLASCLVGAIGALKGPAHGGAPSAVMDQLEKIGTADNAEPWLRNARKQKVRFMGFGHRVYRTYDPRARILKEMCARLNPKFYELASKVEETALQILHEEHPERPQATNVEFYSAGVLQAIGLPKEFFPPTFAVARAAGWTAHVLEQVANNRLIRPQSEYIGPEPRKPVPLAERG